MPLFPLEVLHLMFKHIIEDSLYDIYHCNEYPILTLVIFVSLLHAR